MGNSVDQIGDNCELFSYYQERRIMGALPPCLL